MRLGTDTETPAPAACRFGRFRLDPPGRRLTDEAGSLLPLSGRPFDVLEYLVRHRDRIVSKDELLSAVWPRLIVEENNLTQAVSAIRRALGDSRETSEYVATVAGRGYRFVAPLREDTPEPVAPLPAVSSAPQPAALAWYRRTPAYAAGAAMFLVAAFGTVALRHEPIPPKPGVALRSAQAERPTIAVLPFHTSGAGEEAQLLAQSVTDVLRNRLAAFRGAVVIGDPSASTLTAAQLGRRDVGSRLRARYLLQGRVERAGEALRIDAELIDTTSTSGLWSASFSAVTSVGATAHALARRVAGTLHIDDAPAGRDVPVNLEAYELYMRGQQLTASLRTDDNDQAIELFRRATILDPSFARGYLALGQAQLQADRLRSISARGIIARRPARLPDSGGTSAHVLAEARQALDRALELDPALGEVWVERAGFESDPAKADELYRAGLELAPNYGIGYLRYSEFLYNNYRKGEAIEMIDRARQIDPLTPSLHVRKAFMLMVSRSDVEGCDRLLREALEINPRFHPALVELAGSRHEFSGEFADGIRIIEQSIAVDPSSDFGRLSAARMYLDVEDPEAAQAVLRDGRETEDSMAEIAQYQRDRQRAAALARSRRSEPWLGPIAPLAEAVRDEALLTGDYASALELLESQYAMGVPAGTGFRMWSRGLGLVYAHTLVLAGQAQRGRELTRTILVQIDSESVGRTKDWFSRERAAAYAVLGDDERTLAELEASARTRKFYRWWYVAERDPLYEHLRSNARFQALAEQARQHRRSQRALLEELRRKGEVPPRVS